MSTLASDADRPYAVQILGSRGIPNSHGGFEAFAENLAPYLVRRGWTVTVYCQDDHDPSSPDPLPPVREEFWNGVRLIHVPVRQRGALGTVVFDWKATRISAARPELGLPLILGYNTAVFSAVYKARGVANVINMDGVEWKRSKYSFPERVWFYLNEWCGCLLGDHLIADHPEIARRLAGRVSSARMTTIPYGARIVHEADTGLLTPFGLTVGDYALLIARPEPENSILEIVRAFSRKRRGHPLVVLGRYRREVAFQRAVLDAASDEVRFVGAIYDRATVDALRAGTRLYIHGHTVGGTNPALVEALGAGTPVLAHDNPFNRWVCGPEAAAFFGNEDACATRLDEILPERAGGRRETMRTAARRQHAERFTLEQTLDAYEAMLARFAPRAAHAAHAELPPIQLPAHAETPTLARHTSVARPTSGERL